MADPLPDLGWHHAHAWLPLRADQVQAGHVYANWGTVTAVHHGPTLPLGSADDLADGEVRIECGETVAVWALLADGSTPATPSDSTPTWTLGAMEAVHEITDAVRGAAPAEDGEL